MKNQSGFSWLLIRYMSLVAVVAFMLVVVGSSVYLVIGNIINPDAPGGNSGSLTIWDFSVLGLVLVLSLTVAAALGWTLGNKVIRPISEIDVAADAIARGNFTARAHQHGMNLGEVSQLVDNFNRMAELLENAETELRYQNSSIAHELRTPLTILKGRVQGLSDGVFEPSLALYSSLINQVDGLTRIVEDLRTLALFKVGRLELKLETIDVSEVVGSAFTALEGEFERVGTKVELDLGKVVLMADPNRVQQAVLAILHNATRYAPGTRLRIETRVSGADGVIRCIDAGPGLTTLALKKVFEPFWRSDESRSREFGGSGLGLPVVQAIASAHNGDVVASCNDWGGATFTLTIPMPERQSISERARPPGQ